VGIVHRSSPCKNTPRRSRDGDVQVSRRRVDLRTAAESLGTSVDAVRKRIQRGTLESEKGEDGEVYVWLDAGLEGESGALISELRDRVDFLQRELERKDAILLNMTEAMKALNPPPAQEESSEPREEVPVTAAEEMRESHPATEGAMAEGAQIPWWRRWFGG
jgi:hypothetical protein